MPGDTYEELSREALVRELTTLKLRYDNLEVSWLAQKTVIDRQGLELEQLRTAIRHHGITL